jgi:lipopolysaccharide biosynthesis glycosyltransferase
LEQQIVPYNNFSLKFINVSEYIKKYNFWTENRDTITNETYFRLLIPYIFNEYDKIIYLDSDMVSRADIADLYNLDIHNNLIAAARDILGISFYYGKHRKKEYIDYVIRYTKIGITKFDDYFIAATLVFNCAEFRKSISLNSLLELAVSRKWQFHDQDILNYLCKDKVTYIPFEWAHGDIGDDFSNLPEDLKNQYLVSLNNFKIFHFASNNKPWRNAENIAYFHLFWKYALRTPFAGTIVDRMVNGGYIKPNSYYIFNIKNHDISNFTIHKIFENIKHRKGLGLKFILRCLFCWLSRDKKVDN